MINKLPFIGWAFSFIASVSLSVPFWFIWTFCGIGEKYFYFLPTVYHSIPFWSSVGLFMVVGILKAVLTPKFATVSQTVKNNTKEEE